MMTVQTPVLIQPTISRPALVRSASAIPKATSNTSPSPNAIGAMLLCALALCLLPSLSWAQGVTPSPYQLFTDNSGLIVPSGCIWTYAAGTTTAATTYSNEALSTPNANPIIAGSDGKWVAYLPAGQSFKFVYEDTPCSASSHGSVIKTVDNVNSTPSNSGGVDVVGTAGEALSAGDAVYLSDGSGSKTAGDWYLASNANSYSSMTNPVGMVQTAIGSGSTGTIRVQGTISGLTSLTIGLVYYVGTGGAITSTQPTTNSRRLGVADTTSSLVLQPALTLPSWGIWSSYASSTTLTGWSATTTKLIAYQKVGTIVFVQFRIVGTSNATTAKFTVPYTAESTIYTTGGWGGALSTSEDAGSLVSTTGVFFLDGNSTTVECFPSNAEGNWTASGTKIVEGQFWYVTGS